MACNATTRRNVPTRPASALGLHRWAWVHHNAEATRPVQAGVSCRAEHSPQQKKVFGCRQIAGGGQHQHRKPRPSPRPGAELLTQVARLVPLGGHDHVLPLAARTGRLPRLAWRGSWSRSAHPGLFCALGRSRGDEGTRTLNPCRARCGLSRSVSWEALMCTVSGIRSATVRGLVVRESPRERARRGHESRSFSAM